MKTIVVGLTGLLAAGRWRPVPPRPGPTRTAWAAARRTRYGSTSHTNAYGGSTPARLRRRHRAHECLRRQHGARLGRRHHAHERRPAARRRALTARARSTPPPPATARITRPIPRPAPMRRTIRRWPSPTTRRAATTAAARRRPAPWSAWPPAPRSPRPTRRRPRRMRMRRASPPAAPTPRRRTRRAMRRAPPPRCGAGAAQAPPARRRRTTYAMGMNYAAVPRGFVPGQQERHDVLPQRQHLVPAGLRSQRRLLPRCRHAP